MDFWKYHGAGNDFILVDQRQKTWLRPSDRSVVERLCDRRFGIGADGLILLERHPQHPFRMVYFNADGRESTLCGNGGRCIAAFAHQLGILETDGVFLAIDGEHRVRVEPSDDHPGAYWVELHMHDVEAIEDAHGAYVLNTGSPHYVRFVDDTSGVDMRAEGRAVRYSERFDAEGINVNLAQVLGPHALRLRTYERGVEDETLACGTGVTAAALAYARLQPESAAAIDVEARGGNLQVRFKRRANGAFYDIWLCGPAQRVFYGNINLPDRHAPLP